MPRRYPQHFCFQYTISSYRSKACAGAVLVTQGTVHENYFSRRLSERIRQGGGILNAHCHIDRFATAGPQWLPESYDHEQLEKVRLWSKQDHTRLLHRSEAYQRGSLEQRMQIFLHQSIELGVRRVDSFIDIAEDIALDGGHGALNTALTAKASVRGRIDFRVGAYAPFGFKASCCTDWDLFEAAAAVADFIATSPERDDPVFYGAEPDHIGLDEHFHRTLALALDLGKPLHYHIDQQVSPHEGCSEALLDHLESSSVCDRLLRDGDQLPLVWLVHMISPVTYRTQRLRSLLDRIAAYRIGIICCPSAGLSMRKYSFVPSQLNASVAPVLELLERDIPVRLGTDNVDDMFLPATSLDMRNEVNCLANALRFYGPGVLAKLACGRPLGQDDTGVVAQHLAVERREYERYGEQLRRLGMEPGTGSTDGGV